MILLLTAVFLATMAFVVGGYVLVNRRTLEIADAARSRLKMVDTSERSWSLMKEKKISDVPFLNRLLSGKTWIEAIDVQLARAGSGLKPVTFLLIILTCGALGSLVGLRIGGVAAILFMAVGWRGPFVWLRRKQRKRMTRFTQQLPEAIDMLVNGMKAGYSFQAATHFIAEEMPAPLGPEFGRFYDEQRLGVDVRTALLSLQLRVDSIDLKMFVTAVLIQRETGGNLGEVLSNLADLMRDRIAMRGHVETLVAEPKLSAQFLAILPVIVVLLLSMFNPHFFDPMLAAEGGGRAMLVGTAFSVALGYWIMMRIADIDG